jgi:hypothetical protein
LRWNFNIENKVWDGINIAYRGIQPHSWDFRKKTKLLYEWADEWQLPIQKQLK